MKTTTTIAIVIGFLGFGVGAKALLNEIAYYDYKAQINLQEGYTRVYQANVDKATCYVAVTTHPKQFISTAISCLSNKSF